MLLELSEIILSLNEMTTLELLLEPKKENLATLRRQLKLQRETHLNPRSINPHVLCVAQPFPTGPEKVRDY